MNKPNILSNELDQVAKTGAWYQKELHTNKEVKQQIIDAFDAFEHNDFPMEENDFFIDSQVDRNILDWLLDNRKNLPMEQIWKMLRTTKRVSCEIKRQKKDVEWWNTAIGHMIPKDTVQLWTTLTQNKENAKGHVVTYLTFTSLNGKPQRPDVQISAQQIEFPGEWAMLPEYMVFQKELTGDELNKENITL